MFLSNAILNDSDTNISFMCVITNFSYLKTKNDKDYISMIVSDGASSIQVVDWDCVAYKMKVGNVVTITGAISEYNGSKQVKLISIMFEFEGVHDERAKDIPGVSKSFLNLKYNVSNDLNFIRKSIEDFAGFHLCDPVLKDIIKLYLSDKILPGLNKCSASKSVHHNYAGGLLEHTFELFLLWSSIQSLPMFDAVNHSIMLMGILFHDYGKKFDYKIDNSSKTIDNTEHIALIGHIYAGARAFEDFVLLAEKSSGAKLDKALKNKIIHLILSHHNTLEWGSPVIPATQEAHLLHYIDQISAKNNIWLRAAGGARNFFLGNAITIK